MPSRNKFKYKTIALSLILGVIFLYLSVKDLHWKQVKASFSLFNAKAVFFFFFLQLLMIFFRGGRWYFLVKQLQGPDRNFIQTFKASITGFAAILIFPFRLGEFIRPLLLASPKHTGRPRKSFSSLFGTIIVERITDGLLISTLLILTFFWYIKPDTIWLLYISLIAAFFFLLALTILFLSIFFPAQSLELIKKYTLMNYLSQKSILLQRASSKFSRIYHGILQGFSTVKNPRQFTVFLLMTFAYWTVNWLSIYYLAQMFRLNLPPAGAFFVLGFSVIGIFIPSPPGHIGNFEYFALLGLSICIAPSKLQGAGIVFVFSLHLFQLLAYLAGGLTGLLAKSYKLPDN
ncbi:MAG: lysylphosphatidylglycerol synthase transmembrane domain-containing protein [Myxococcota bacterium]